MSHVEKIEDEEETIVKNESSEVKIEDTSTAEAESITMATPKFEPPAFVSESKNYAEYKKDLQMWSRITGIPKKSQAEVVVYSLDGHPSRIKEKIVLNIGDQIQHAEDGIKILINFLDSIYKEDDMADAWMKYKNFQKIARSDSVMMNDFIAEFEKEYLLAKSVGCEYSDTLLAFRLLEATNLSEMDEKFVLTGVDYTDAKVKKNLYEQMKLSLKKFQGRKAVSGDEQKIRYDPALVSSVTQVLISQGWKKPGRRRSNTDPAEVKRSNYKGKKNPLGFDGKPLSCFKCGSVYHFQDKCTKKQDENVLITSSRLRAEAPVYGI